MWCVCVCVHTCALSVTQMYLTLCNPMDYTPSGSSVLGIFQARLLEWVAMSSSRGSSQPRDETCVLCFLHCVSCIGRWILHDCATWKRVCVCVCVFVYILTCVTIWLCLRNMLSVRSHMQKGFRLSDLICMKL